MIRLARSSFPKAACCLLVLVQYRLQIWVCPQNDAERGFGETENYVLPDRDGTVDMVFPTCDSVSTSSGLGTNCFINIVYNKQKPLCSSSTPAGLAGRQNCRMPEDLCSSDLSFTFDFSDVPTNDVRTTSTTRLTAVTEYNRDGRHTRKSP